MRKFLQGLKDGLPIALGYLSVSFTFGLKTVIGGMPFFASLIISMTNLTSAGQFAGADIILKGGTILELAISMFIINIRYFLMSFSLSQKIEQTINLPKRLIMSFSITDEIYAVSAAKIGKIDFKYFMGLALLPYIGWSLGTLMGAVSGNILPETLRTALGLAIYGMFIAIVVPPAKKSKPIAIVSLMAIVISVVFRYTPVLNSISSGWIIIIATVGASALGALLFAKEDENV